MPEVTVTLEDVESKNVTARGELTTVYEVKASDGRKYGTFKHPLAQEAAKLRGQTVVIEYKERQKGDYVNYDLLGVKVAGPGAMIQTNLSSDGPLSTVSFEPQTGVNAENAAHNTSSKDTSIARAVALKAAICYEPGMPTDEVLEIADTFVEWLLTGTTTPAESLVQF